MFKNNIYNLIPYIFLLSFCCFSSLLSAQFNLNVGYNGTYLENQLTNDILQRYNENTPWLTTSFKDVHIMDGIVAGAQYKLEPISFLLQWTNKSKNQKAKGINPVTEEEAFRDLRIQYNNFSVGLEVLMGPVGLGGTVDYNYFFIKTAHTDMEDKYNVLSDKSWSSHFFIKFRMHESSQMAINIQPYVHIPWTTINLIELEQELNPDIATTANPADYEADFKNFGISLIFSNGKQ